MPDRSPPHPAAVAFGEAAILDPAPRWQADGAVVYGVVDRLAEGRAVPPVLSAAWLAEHPGTSLEHVLAEELPRALDPVGSALLDRAPAEVDGHPAVRTLMLHHEPSGATIASEQWRVLAHGLRVVLTATTALEDQAELGPRLAAVAASATLRAVR